MIQDINKSATSQPAFVLERITTHTIEIDDIQSRGINGLMIIFFVFTTIIIIYPSYTNGPAATSRYIGDDFILFNGAWRSYNNQASSDDFYNPMGFFYFYIFAFAMKLLGPQVTTIAYTVVAVNLILVLWSWSVFRRRLSFATAIALTIAIGAHLFSNKIPDYAPNSADLSIR